MMDNFLRLAVGILGSVCGLLMYGAPITTFRRVIQKRTTESFSGFPYAIALFNCLISILYGSLLISNGWHNVIIMVVNIIGLFLQCSFVGIYLTFAPPKNKKSMGRMVMGVMAVFATIVITCFCAIHDHKHKRVIVGTAGIVSTTILYGSPLSIIRLVIQTKSVEFMPSFYFSLFVFLGSASWIMYGALSRDIIIMAPNFLGAPLGFGQMVLYCIYPHRKSGPAEDTNVNADKQLESTEEKIEDDKTNCISGNIELQLNV